MNSHLVQLALSACLMPLVRAFVNYRNSNVRIVQMIQLPTEFLKTLQCYHLSAANGKCISAASDKLVSVSTGTINKTKGRLCPIPLKHPWSRPS